MPETFTPFTWADDEVGGTPITATQLNRIEAGVESMDDRVTAIEAGGSIPDGSVTNTKVATNAAISLDKTADSATRLAMTSSERTKLTGVATGATANATDAALRDRSTHTGTQNISTLATTGTASGSTYLRGDGAWAIPEGGGGSASLVHNVGNSGTSLTLDAASASGWIKTITMTGNCTFTLTGATSGELTQLELILTQDATGNRTATWPASVKWSGGAPVLSGPAASVDRLLLTSYNGGTTWYGDVIGKAYA